MSNPDNQTTELRSAFADSTTGSLVALFLILITVFVWLISRSQPDPHSGSTVLESVQKTFGQSEFESSGAMPAMHLSQAANLLLAAGGKTAALRDDVPGDIRVFFASSALFENGSSALTPEGRTAVKAIAAASRAGGPQLRADVLVPPQGNVLTALDSVRIAVLASTLEGMGAPMGQLRLGLAADSQDGLVVGLGIVRSAGSAS